MEKRNCLITGATGYIGSHLTTALLERGCTVTALVRPQSDTSKLNSDVHRLTMTTDPTNLRRALQALKPDFVFHLAGGFSENFENDAPLANLEANFQVGYHLAWALGSEISKLVNVSSYWEFTGPSQNSANSIYAALKSSYRHFLSALPEQRKIAHVNIVLFDVYGPRDPRSKLLPLLLSGLRTGTHLPLTEGRQIMDLVHVRDVCDGLIRAALSPLKDGEVRSLSSGDTHSVRALVEKLEGATKSELNVDWGAKAYSSTAIFEPVRSLRNLENWQCQISLEEGLRSCIDL